MFVNFIICNFITVFVKTSEKARFIAKTSIVERKPCGTLGNCNNIADLNVFSPPKLPDFYDNKVFPVEVDDIKDYMHDTFTTNVNGYALSELDKLKNGLSEISNNMIPNFFQKSETRSQMQSYENPSDNPYFSQYSNGMNSNNLNKYYLNSKSNNRHVDYDISQYSDFPVDYNLEETNETPSKQNEKTEKENLNINNENNNKNIDLTNKINEEPKDKANDQLAKKALNNVSRTNEAKLLIQNYKQKSDAVNGNKPIIQKQKQNLRKENEEIINNHKLLRRFPKEN